MAIDKRYLPRRKYSPGSIDALIRTLVTSFCIQNGPLDELVAVPYGMDNVSKQNCHVGLHCTHTAPYLWTLDKFEYLGEVPNAAINSYVLQEDFQHQLQTLKLYFANIDRHRDLENVLFFLDELLSYSPGELSQYNYRNDEDIRKRDTIVKMAKEHEEEIMRDLIYFIKEHNRRFNNQQNAVQFEFSRLLSTLRLPTSINTLNWVQFAANVPSTDLTCVQEISLSKNKGFARTLSISSDDCKKEPSSSLLQEKQEDGRSLLARHGLVLLEEVNITESPAAPLTDEMNDIVFGSSRTLTKLQIYGPHGRPPTISIQQGTLSISALQHVSGLLIIASTSLLPQWRATMTNRTTISTVEMMVDPGTYYDWIITTIATASMEMGLEFASTPNPGSYFRVRASFRAPDAEAMSCSAVS
ncbi:MAG: hypothetical protein J3R72DRAFT_499086 [Linnemannia gamsii]|nr:MAG: hypothetical protein J3R72DRAFT_499086 [Linnemannia gamsii]